MFSTVGIAPDVVCYVEIGQVDVGVGRADDVGGGVDAGLQPLASGGRRRARSQCALHHRRWPRQHFKKLRVFKGALRHRLKVNDDCWSSESVELRNK